MIVLLMMVPQAEVVDKSVDDVRLGRCFDISVVDREKKKSILVAVGLVCCLIGLSQHSTSNNIEQHYFLLVQVVGL